MGNCPTELRRAIRMDDIDHVQKILDHVGDQAADIINEDHSPDCILGSCRPVQGNAFYYAVSHNRQMIAQLLLQRGADIYSTGVLDESCLHSAARHNNVDMARMLVDHGSIVYATDDLGRYPLHSAASSIYNTTAMIKYLLKEAGKEEDINLRDFAGRTPLHEAAFYGNVEVVTTLLQMGADVNARSNEGNTPLHAAHSHPVIRKILLEHGADDTLKNNSGQTPEQLV